MGIRCSDGNKGNGVSNESNDRYILGYLSLEVYPRYCEDLQVVILTVVTVLLLEV